MANCKKCGKVLKVTNLIFSVKENSSAEKIGLMKGNSIVAIDGEHVNSKDDIDRIINDKQSCKITINQKNESKELAIENCKAFISEIDFADEEICSACGTKQKNKILPLIIAVISIGLVAGIFVAVLPKKNDTTNVEPKPEVVEISDKNSKVSDKPILNETIIKKLEETLSSDEGESRSRSSSTRTEVTYATDENGNLVNLRDTILEGSNLDDGISINTTTRNNTGSSDTSKRTRGASKSNRGGSNDSLESTLENIDEIKDTVLAEANISDITEKLSGKVPFEYGSYLDIGNMSVEVEKYLLVQKLESEKKEYASIVLGLNDLISKIPEEKRDSAVFIVMGYADTTLFNGIPEISERSEKFNTELSLKRAESIKTILIGKDFKISPDKVVTYGFGYSKNANETTNLERFRRVDVVVSFN